MHRNELLSLLDRHQTRFMDESAFVRKAQDYVRINENCFYRELWPGHVTGSAWVVNPSRDHVLLLHHRKHDQWFQPGGHADGDHDILRVALRETSEETGLDPEHIQLVDNRIFDVDIHAIPATPHEGKLEPAHQHIDIRFLLEIDDAIPIPGNDESHQVLWVPLNRASTFNNNRSTYRMVEKDPATETLAGGLILRRPIWRQRVRPIRQYLPKGESMAGLTQQRCNAIADKFNRRPRKRLGYRTPEECFYGN